VLNRNLVHKAHRILWDVRETSVIYSIVTENNKIFQRQKRQSMYV